MALIFVLEDDRDARNSLCGFLEEIGHHRTLGFEKPSLFFKGLEENEKPDIITSDFEMPEWNGLEVVQKLKADELTRKIPVVIISSVAYNEEACKNLFAAGVAKIFPKPFKISELLAAIAELTA